MPTTAIQPNSSLLIVVQIAIDHFDKLTNQTDESLYKLASNYHNHATKLRFTLPSRPVSPVVTGVTTAI